MNMGVWYGRAMFVRFTSRRGRPHGPAALAGTLLAVVVGSIGPVAAAGAPSPVAAGGRMNETITLKLERKVGFTFRHTGSARGSVPGSARSTLKLTRLSLKGTATIRNGRGTVRLQVDARARSGGTRARFSGKARVAGGTGAYRRARGSARISGVVNRRTWAASITATGTLYY